LSACMGFAFFFWRSLFQLAGIEQVTLEEENDIVLKSYGDVLYIFCAFGWLTPVFLFLFRG
jgi:hypothetical protein